MEGKLLQTTSSGEIVKEHVDQDHNLCNLMKRELSQFSNKQNLNSYYMLKRKY